MASPTSCVSGIWVCCRFLPLTDIVAARQSMSARRSCTTSPARRPNLAKSSKMARSRLPTEVCVSALSSTRSTSSGCRYCGSDDRRQCATLGIASTNLAGHCPWATRNRMNVRSAEVAAFTLALPTFWLGANLCQERLQILAVVTQSALGDSALFTHPAAKGIPQFGWRCLDLGGIVHAQWSTLLKCHEGANTSQEPVLVHVGKSCAAAVRKMAFESIHGGGIGRGQ